MSLAKTWDYFSPEYLYSRDRFADNCPYFSKLPIEDCRKEREGLSFVEEGFGENSRCFMSTLVSNEFEEIDQMYPGCFKI
jgi:Leishmanolysin